MELITLPQPVILQVEYAEFTLQLSRVNCNIYALSILKDGEVATFEGDQVKVYGLPYNNRPAQCSTDSMRYSFTMSTRDMFIVEVDVGGVKDDFAILFESWIVSKSKVGKVIV